MKFVVVVVSAAYWRRRDGCMEFVGLKPFVAVAKLAIKKLLFASIIPASSGNR